MSKILLQLYPMRILEIRMGLQFTQHMTRKIECNGSILAYLVYKSFIY